MQPWKNGGGVTRVIHEDPSVARAWRISVATIEEAGAFSLYAGYDRTFIPLDYALKLRIDGRDTAALPLFPLRFSGEATVESVLSRRPVHDLNVMTKRDAGTHRVEIHSGEIEITVFLRGGTAMPDDATCTVVGFTQSPTTVTIRFVRTV